VEAVRVLMRWLMQHSGQACVEYCPRCHKSICNRRRLMRAINAPALKSDLLPWQVSINITLHGMANTALPYQDTHLYCLLLIPESGLAFCFLRYSLVASFHS
jgi:hypothetical protein